MKTQPDGAGVDGTDEWWWRLVGSDGVILHDVGLIRAASKKKQSRKVELKSASHELSAMREYLYKE